MSKKKSTRKKVSIRPSQYHENVKKALKSQGKSYEDFIEEAELNFLLNILSGDDGVKIAFLEVEKQEA